MCRWLETHYELQTIASGFKNVRRPLIQSVPAKLNLAGKSVITALGR